MRESHRVPPRAWPAAREDELLDPPRPRARAVVVALGIALLVASVMWLPTKGAIYVLESHSTGAAYWTDSEDYASEPLQWRWLWERELRSGQHPGYRSAVVARVHWPLFAGTQGIVLLFAGLALTWAMRHERRSRANLGFAPSDAI